MKSNLLVGDFLFVSKFSYGYSRYSFPLGLAPIKGRIFASEPKRGDVVVFRNPHPPYLTFIKRLMGLPGDTIQVKQGLVYINGTPLKREFQDNFTDAEANAHALSVPRYTETLPEGKKITILKRTKEQIPPHPQDEIDADNTDVYTVPEGHYFMMGDNRNNSRDSRYTDEVGFVPFENLIGRADILFFSVDTDEAELFKPWTWVTAARYSRFLQFIH